MAYKVCRLIIDTFVSEGVQEEYDDLKNVREYVSDMLGTFLKLFYTLYTYFF